jgi:hypothetical protein
VWIDGSIQVLQPLDMTVLLGDSSLAFFDHPQRKCAYQEAEVVIRRRKDDASVVRAQMRRYQEEGFPPQYGLVMGGMIFRRHNVPKVVRLMDRWWGEVANGSHRDQLSFSFSKWKEDVGFTLPLLHSQRLRKKFFSIHPHSGCRGRVA